MTSHKIPRDTSKDTAYVWYDEERGYIFRDEEPAPEPYVPDTVTVYSCPIPNPVVLLVHATMNRATLTSKQEWQLLAKDAIVEYDRVCAENYKLRLAVKNFGPKFQGMNELA